MTLYERAGQLDQLAGFAAESRRGRGRVVLVSGVAGAGKTALLHEFWAGLPDDAVVLSASCVRSESNLPFATLTELFESPDLGVEDNSRAARVLDDCASLSQSQPRGPARAAAVERGLTRLVLEMSERRPVVICVDDIHHSDPESVVHLLRLARRLYNARVLAVFTEVTRLVDPQSRMHAELFGLPHVMSIRLGPLSPRGVQEMITAATEADTGARLAADFHRSTGGSPLLVRAMVQDLRDPGQAAVDDASATNPTYRHTVLTCLRSASPLTLRVARGIALLDENTTPRLLGRLLDLPLETVTQCGTELETIGLVHASRLRRRSAVKALLGDMAPDDRMSWHLRAARLLFESTAGAPDVAGHLLHAHTASEPWMADVLLEAAGLLLDSDAQRARACLELARRCASADTRRQSDIAAALARTELRLSPMAALRLLPQLRTAISEGNISPQLALELPHILHRFGRAEDHERLYQHLERLAEGGDPRMAMELGACRALLTTVFPQLATRIPDTLDQGSGVPPTGASFSITTRLTIYGALNTILMGEHDGDAVRSAEHVLAVTRLTDATAGLLADAVSILIGADETRSAQTWADRLLKEAANRGAAFWQAMMAVQRAHIALNQGDLPDVERYARLALDQAPPQALGVATAGLYATMLRALTERGRHADATELLIRPVPDETFDSIYGLQYLHAKGHHYLATHQYQDALSDFRACGGLMADWGLDRSPVVPWRCGAAEALLRLGIPDQARRLVEEHMSLLPSDHNRPSRQRGTALRILAATLEPRDRGPLLTEAVAALQLMGDRVELAKALTELSEAQQRLGDTAQARMTARRAWHTGLECDAVPVADRACAASGDATDNAFRAGPPAPAPPEEAAGAGPSADEKRTAEARLPYLSDAERRVCVLAGRGLTNREIAGLLFITVSTVEQHLTRIYRKLQVKGRQALPAEAATGSPEDAARRAHRAAPGHRPGPDRVPAELFELRGS